MRDAQTPPAKEQFREFIGATEQVVEKLRGAGSCAAG